MAGRNNGKMKKPKMMMEGGPLQPLSPPRRKKPIAKPKRPKGGMKDPMGRKMLAAGGSGKARKGFSGGGVSKPAAKKPNGMMGGGSSKPKAKKPMPGMKSGGVLKGKAGKRASGPQVVSFQDYIKKMFG